MAKKQEAKGTVRQVMIGNTLREVSGNIETQFKSYTDKKTAIASYKRKVTYHSKRPELGPIPTMSHGLTEQECKELLKQWGHLDD